MEFLVIRKTQQGYAIRDTLTQNKMHYIGYSKREAIRQYRREFNLVGKNFAVIEI